jgi:nicotinamide-nucleotide amidase
MTARAAARLGARLRAAGALLAVAESCTGGLLGARLTAVAGSSDWFAGGVIAYSNDVKIRLLGVPASVLKRRGAVSEETALAMAKGARKALRAGYGIGITGIAGPGGAVPGKPVGTVCIAVAGPRSGTSVRFRFGGGRAAVRRAAVAKALDMLDERLGTMA